MKFSLAHLSFECVSEIQLDSTEDDFKREAALRRQALETAAQARRIILAANIPFSRPTGYFCEMLKTEEQMKKIATRIQEQKEADKAAELARKQRQNRKYGKKVQVAREQEKAAQVSAEKKKLGTLQKRKKPVESEDFDDIKIDIDAHDEEGDKRPSRGPSRKREKSVSKKRQARNEKYGFGGPKRGKRRNDKESASVDDFHAGRNREPFRGIGKSAGRGGKKGTLNRPGKARRQQLRNRGASRK